MYNKAKHSSLNKLNLKPLAYERLIRLGNKFDGGYVIPEDQIENSSLLLSLGINDDWLFDKQFQHLNPDCRVVGVDYTVGLWFIIKKTMQYTPKTIINTVLMRKYKRDKYFIRLLNCLFFYSFFRKNNVFLRKKVAKETNDLDVSLADLINAHSTCAPHSVFLKMDIEGGEYDVLDDLMMKSKQIRVIAAEFHNLDTRTAEFNHFIDKILEKFVVVHVHGNNYGAFSETINFPESVELTLVNKDLVDKMEFTNHSYPRKDLDFPNNPRKEDYSLIFE